MTAQEIAERIAAIAADIATCETLDSRDRNAAIGQLRQVAGFVRGAEGLPGFKQAAFAPTTPGGARTTL
jgi:hypothetical protein